MLNRRHIRIKILQLLYAKKTGNIDNVSLLKQFDLASTNFYKFFLTQLLLFKEIFIESERIFNINKNKYFKNGAFFSRWNKNLGSRSLEIKGD